MQKVCHTRTSSSSLRAAEGSHAKKVSTLKSDQSLKTTLGEDTELRLPIWHCGTCKAFLMHMSMAANAIEKRGTFKAYKEACEAYVEQREALKQAKAALALLTATVSKGEKMSKKSSKKVSEMALQKPC